MYTSDQQKLVEVRALTAALDKLTRSPRRPFPSAPWYIPAIMIVVGLFALICLVIKLFMYYLNSKPKKFGLSETSSPEIPTTPEDQTSMATTASMKTRGSLRLNHRHRRNKPQLVSLYQLKQKQSPGSSSSKSKSHKAAMKAISRAAKAEANRSLSRDSTRQVDDGSDDNVNNDVDNSPTNLSQHSDDTDEIKATDQPGMLYGAAITRDETNGLDQQAHNAHQPEVHIVQIRDLEDNLQHPEPAWPQAESEI